MTRFSDFSIVDQLFARVGVVLMVIVALAADRAYDAPAGLGARITGRACLGVIAMVAAVGWTADRFPSRPQPLTVAPAH